MTDETNARPVAVVAGVGPSNGQTLAKRCADAGYAVALLIVDGMVEKSGIEKFIKDKPIASLIDPAALAEAAYVLSQQNPRGWSFEVEVRPALEKW